MTVWANTFDFMVPQPGAWRVRTQTGSRYDIVHDDEGQWWLSGQNVPNTFSDPMPPGQWRIDPPTPWPPAIGARLTLRAYSLFAADSRERLPDGGKHTSPVASVELIPPEEGEEEEDDSPFLSWD